MMPPRKKQVLYGAVIGAGLLALLFDRLFLGGSVAPADAIAVDAAPGAGDLHSASAAIVAGGIPVLPFPRNLPPFDPAIDAQRDIFADPRELLAAQQAKEAAAQQASSKDPPKGVKEFIEHHRLMGTIVSADQRLALIDGERFAVGDELDGFTLVEIVNQAAVFRRGDDVAVLRTPHPLARARDAPTPSP